MSEPEKDNFNRDFYNISDRIFIENLVPCWPNFNPKGIKYGNIGIYGNALTSVQTCPYIFYSIAINSDGLVSLCFLDWNRQLLLGDLRKENLVDIWNSKLLRDYRIWHLSFGRKILRSCENCKQLVYGLPDDIDAYAKEIMERIT